MSTYIKRGLAACLLMTLASQAAATTKGEAGNSGWRLKQGVEASHSRSQISLIEKNGGMRLKVCMEYVVHGKPRGVSLDQGGVCWQHVMQRSITQKGAYVVNFFSGAYYTLSDGILTFGDRCGEIGKAAPLSAEWATIPPVRNFDKLDETYDAVKGIWTSTSEQCGAKTTSMWRDLIDWWKQL